MREILGIPVDSLMTGLLLILGVSLLTVAWIAWRRRVMFKMGMRNIPRRKAQTVLIVAGLMLSTMIISASLGTGDTLNHSVSKDVYEMLGPVDEVVVYSQDSEGEAASAGAQTIPASALELVRNALAGNPDVDAVGAILTADMPALNPVSQQAEASVTVAGIDPVTVETFGGLTGLDGEAIAFDQISQGSVVLGETAASDLDAVAGDALTVYYGNQPVELTVAAIAPDSILTGVTTSGSGGMAMPLAALQAITGQPDTVSMIVISNTGGARDGVDHTDRVVAVLEPALAGAQLGIDPIKQDAVTNSEDFAQLLTSVFLIFGLFSIAAGILLIVLIFTMLAAERRTEMGMARAVGAGRRQLIQQFVAEGMGYALLAGLVGSALGVLASVGIAFGMRLIIGSYFDIEPHVEPRSLVIAYALGAVITFLAVTASSWKISRLNIVAAVRDIPDVRVAKRRWSTLAWGLVMVAAGGFLALTGFGGESGSIMNAGLSLALFGVSSVLRFLGVSARPVLTLVGLLVMVLWLLPEDAAVAVFGFYDAGMDMFFIAGVFVVAATTLVIVQNLGFLLTVLEHAGGIFRGKLPAVRTAVAYPGAARGRTGMTIAMFSLIVLSLVMVATISQNFIALMLGDEANAGWDVRVDLVPENPVDDVEAILAANGVDTSQFTGNAGTTMPDQHATQLRMPDDETWTSYPVVGMSDAFMAGSTLLFKQRAEGYDSDAAIVEALRNDPNVAVIDSRAIPADGDLGRDETIFTVSGITTDDATFAPFTVEVADPDSATPATVTIIGVIDSKVSALWGLHASQATVDAIYPTPGPSSWWVALDDPAAADRVAKEIEAVLLQYGGQAVSIQDELEESQRQSRGLFAIIQGFMGLGLIVGVAAVGVIAFRSVVERRQQIGVLRALGYRQGLVAFSFVFESAFIVATGVIAGVATGLFMSWNLMRSESFGGSEDIDFMIPWNLLGIIIAAAITAALLMAWLPARQAARIAPAEALRYE
jgi:putative ABC transport system permease protein